MKLVTLDFETYYTSTYSLSKLTTEQYIRDPQFEVVGVSVQVDASAPVWFSGAFKDTQKYLESLRLEDSAVLAHNTLFDGAILGWRFGIHPKKLMDTLSMGAALHGTSVGGSLAALSTHYGVGGKGDAVVRAIGKRRLDFTPAELQEYGEYCNQDVALTYSLLGKMLPGFSRLELDLIDLTLKMFTNPRLELDIATLKDHLKTVRGKKAELMRAVAQTFGLDPDTTDQVKLKKSLMSNPQFADVLRACGVTPPMKISPTTGRETYAFSKKDEEFAELEEHPNPAVQALVAARLGNKSTLEETRTERFIGLAQRGPMPVPLRYYAAHTGRWGGTDKVNLQNIPRKSPLKAAIRAPRGYVFIDSDLSQIEARILAWLAGQHDLVAAFDAGEDVYKIMASAIYGKEIADITDPERFVGKTTVLGCGYGMGAAKFQAQLLTFGVNLPLEECTRIINVYRSTYPYIPELWKQGATVLRAILTDISTPFGVPEVLRVEGQQGIYMPNGLRLHYQNLRQTRGEKGTELVYDQQKGRALIPTRIYGGKLVENVCQALARIVMGENIVRVSKKLPVVMTVHDALGAIAPEAEQEQATRYVDDCMRVRPKWAPDLPLACETKVGPAYGLCKKWGREKE